MSGSRRAQRTPREIPPCLRGEHTVALKPFEHLARQHARPFVGVDRCRVAGHQVIKAIGEAVITRQLQVGDVTLHIFENLLDAAAIAMTSMQLQIK